MQTITHTTATSPQAISIVSPSVHRGAVVVGLLAIALIHLLDLPGKWEETRYLGVGYVLVIAASLVLAELNANRVRTWSLNASAALSIAVLAGFVINRTVGMPGANEDIGNWGEPLGLASLFVEVITVWVTLRAVQMLRQSQS